MGVIVYYDDLLISVNRFEEHDRIVMLHLIYEQINVQFNPEKLKYRQSDVKWNIFFFVRRV